MDSLLATMDWAQLTTRSPNPYFGRNERFSHSRYNLYLVTRLIGYTRADCLRLVDDALAALLWSFGAQQERRSDDRKNNPLHFAGAGGFGESPGVEGGGRLPRVSAVSPELIL